MSILPRAEILLGGFAYSLAKWITFTGQAATVTNDAYFAYAMRHGRDNPVTNTATVKPGDETMTQSKPLTIRPATPADVDEVTRIYIDSWNAGFGELMSQADRTVTPDLVERWSHDLARPAPHRWWVAESMGSIVGVVSIGPSRDPVDPQLGELDTITVDPPHWRTGVGRALISRAFQYLVSDGYNEAIVWTVEGYERGIAFYEAMRWRRDGGVRDEGRQIRFRRNLACPVLDRRGPIKNPPTRIKKVGLRES